MAAKVVCRFGFDFTPAEKMLTEAGAQLVPAPLWTEEDIIKHAADADAVIVGATDPYTKRVIQTLRKCKIISRMGIGFNNIDLEEATRQGIPVTVVFQRMSARREAPSQEGASPSTRSGQALARQRDRGSPGGAGP